MALEAAGAEDRADEGVPQSHAQRQGDNLCAAYAQHKARRHG